MAEPFLAAADATRRLTELARRAAAVFASEAAAAADRRLDAAARARHAVCSRLVGAHAAAWDALVPESVLLAPVAADAAAAPLPDAGSLVAYRAAVEALAAAASPVADGAAVRVARAVLTELDQNPLPLFS